MGSTPRDKLTQIPLPTRSSEAGAECFGRIVLTYLRQDEEMPATFFILGSALHAAIEQTILEDLYINEAEDRMKDYIVEQMPPKGVQILTSSKRKPDEMFEDGERMLANWFRFVHPDSPKRHPVYEGWNWPPKVEEQFYRDDLGTRYPVWGAVDAVFDREDVGDGGPLDMLVDWKSGVKRPASSFQLDFYRFGMQVPYAAAHYHMLDRVRPSSVVVEAGKYDGLAVRSAISKAERAKDAVLRGQMPVFNPDWYCGYCPVQHLCPEGGDFRNSIDNQKELDKLVAEAVPLERLEL